MTHNRVTALSLAAIAASFVLPGCSSQPGPRDRDESRRLVKDAVVLNDQGKFSDAESKLREAVKRDNANASAHLNLGIVLENVKSDHEAAAEEFTKAVNLDPRLELARRKLGETRYIMGDRERARQQLEIATRDDPKDAIAWYDLGIVAMDERRVDTAKAAFETAVALAPGDSASHYHLALALEPTDVKRACTEYEKTIELRPRHVDAMNNLAILLEREDPTSDRPLELWNRALAIDPEFAAAEKNLGAALYLDRKRAKEAMPHFQRYLDLGGDDARVKRWMTEARDAS